jgi:hypothetical protein
MILIECCTHTIRRKSFFVATVKKLIFLLGKEEENLHDFFIRIHAYTEI